MQQVTMTVDEQLIEKAIREECPWESLPKRVQAIHSTKEEWHNRIVDYCIKKRLQWNRCFARKVCYESEYYEEMLRYLQKNLAIFPYHLAEYVCRVMRVSPFQYYCDMIFEVMRNEQPYDSIPNFSAADALRLTGIGRNEFMDIMNKCRSKKIMWKLNKSIARDSLPLEPVDFAIEPWWGICLVNFSLEEFKKLSGEEMATVDKVSKEEGNSFVQFDPDIVKALYRRGLIYFDVPVSPDDRFKVSRLEGFVSNREQSYEDPIEELLYAVFVVSSENVTVAELATTLQADLLQLQAAASFVCRLGWATKVLDPASILQDISITGSPRSSIDGEDASRIGLIAESMLIGNDSNQQEDASWTGNYGHSSASAVTRVALIVDANITSYLMMGSVSPGLKSHAVTLYEAGKLGHASISDLCKDLSTLEGAKFEGVLQEFANHAFSLRCVLECLLSSGIANATNAKVEEGFYKMGIITSSNDDPSYRRTEIPLTGTAGDSGISESGKNNDNLLNLHSEKYEEASVTSDLVPGYTGDVSHPIILQGDRGQTPEFCKSETNLLNDEKLIAVEGSDVESEMLSNKKKYRVDILRSESLAALPPAALERLFLRDYDLVVSIVPLPQSSVLPGPSGPAHFGPPSYCSMTPWMKLILYSTVASGPLSVVLMKGQCLRLLPAPLAGCEKALIWSWDGSTVGGLGGKLEGNLVKGNTLLHCLNSLLKHSAVLVQPLSRYDLDKSGKVITVDIPLPLKNSDGSIAPVGKELRLRKEEILKLNSLLTDLANRMELWTVGFIRLLKLFKGRESDQCSCDEDKFEWVPLSVEFGMPLFSPKLCSSICKRVVSSGLLQTGSFGEHHDSMQSIRKRLHDICAEYQPTGPAANILYQKRHVVDASPQLMNYASGRLNPSVDPLPISGALSGHQGLKLANQQRCLTEVLSFDGRIPRSNAFTPVYEAATRPVEEIPQADMLETESDPDENDSKEVLLPGVNLIFNGSELHPFDVGSCLQARQPVSLIAEAAAACASMAVVKKIC
ncbi:protein FAM91A1 [Neltuma alba]|uniref:protein FAM91A1 n=1 Tax=Neltuma alba TaxID=207710 RepID=UPI0010A59C34|nr:protein FAM91A1-like [Prosopis alba]